MISAAFGPAGDGGWEDYDITNNLGVPANSVAEIVLENDIANQENTIGVRANGSGLSRYFTLHEAEQGGQTHLTLLVQVDSGGIIEIHSQDTSDTYHYCVGYFEGVTYSEAMTEWQTGSPNSWNDKDLSGVATASRVYEIVVENAEVDVSNEGGVRANGTGLSRDPPIHEQEGGGREGYSTFVLGDAGSIIECWAEDENNIYFTFVGEFDSATSFTQRQDSLSAGGDAGWEDEALSGYGVPSGAVCAVLCFNREAGTENELGVRDDGTAISRLFDEHEAEPGGIEELTGFRMCVNAGTDANRTIDIYEEDESESILYLHGWFTWSAGPVGTDAAFSIIPLMVATGMIA